MTRPATAAGERTGEGLPAWLISVGLHAILLFVAAEQLKGCGGPSPEIGDGTEPARTVGLVARAEPGETEAEDAAEEAEPNNAPAESPPTEPTAADIPSAESFFPDDPLADVFAAADDFTPPPLIDAAPAPTTPAAAAASSAAPRVRDDGGEAPTGEPLPPGHTLFFGVADGGRDFVYVLDCSGSMAEVLPAAKAELLASLAALDAAQRFQVVFYNDSVRTLKLPGRRDSELIPATDLNRTRAAQIVATVDVSGGTDRRLAFEQALAFRPDVVFFLSDTDDPLRLPDLDDIRVWNRSAARIHTIEFGLGADLGDDNFLRRIARRHGGTHSYFDVRAFR